MEFGEESITDRVALNYPADYRNVVAEKIRSMSRTDRRLSEVSARKLDTTCQQLHLDDLQAKFAFVCARTKQCTVPPQIYAYFANLTDPGKKFVREVDIEVIMRDNFEKPNFSADMYIRWALNASDTLNSLYAIYGVVRAKIPNFSILRDRSVNAKYNIPMHY